MKQHRNSIVAAVAAVAVVVAWVFVVWNPQSKTLNASKSKANAADKEVTSLRTDLARLKGLEAHAAADQAAMGKISAALPSDADLPDLLLQIHAAAQAAGVDEQTVSPAPPAATAVAPGSGSSSGSGSGTGSAASGTAASGTAASGTAASGSGSGSAASTAGDAAAAAKLQQVKLTLQVSGSSAQFLDFVNRLNGLSRLIVVDSITLGGGSFGATSSTGKFTGAITAHAFVRPATVS